LTEADSPISFWIAWGDSAPNGKRNTPQDSCRRFIVLQMGKELVMVLNENVTSYKTDMKEKCVTENKFITSYDKNKLHKSYFHRMYSNHFVK
jgi:hypothetical protein